MNIFTNQPKLYNPMILLSSYLQQYLQDMEEVALKDPSQIRVEGENIKCG